MKDNIQYRGYLLWSSLPNEIENSNTFSEFKRKIQLWKGDTRSCRQCKVFIKDIGYL